jgi:hypothetical protein
VEPADISRKKKEGTSERQNQELATKNKNRNIRDLYRGINECKRSYQPKNKLVKDEIHTVF